LEAYWSGKLTQSELLSISADVQAADWELQAAAGITRIGIDGTLYDQVLDTTFALGLAPVRFSNFSGLELYFAMARGASGVGALDMSKFFDTNYHYLVSAGWDRRCAELQDQRTCRMCRIRQALCGLAG
jgi:5-methyltetrahydropteroyltriglutamate--homocysteine methyltransferase